MTTLLDKLKSDVPQISDEFRNLAKKIANITPDDYPKKWLTWADSYRITDKEALKFFADVDSGKRSIKDIDTYMQSASTTTSKFGATLKTVAANIGIMLAINVGIWAVGKAWDYFANRVENAREATAQSVSTFNSLTTEADNLDKKLTELNNQINSLDPIVNADDIANLKEQTDELETQRKILEERRRLAGLDAEKNAVQALTLPERSDYAKSYRYDELGTKIEDYAYLSKPDELQAIIDSYDTYAKAIEDAEAEQARLIESGQGSSKAFKEQQKIIDENTAAMINAKKGAGEVYATIEENSKGLIGATDEGAKLKSVIDDLTKSYSDFIDKTNGNDAENIIPDSDSSISNNKPVFNLADEDTAKEIDNFQKQFATLSSAIDKVKNSSLSGSDLLDLQQEFPELIDTTDELDVALSKLVNETLNQAVNYLETADSADGLIDTFRQLADEANGMSTVNWSGTFDVFDQASSQMKSLAEFNKALGSSFTITSDEARKFSEVFPEILSLGQVTSSGLIQFNSDVVNSFIEGKQAEIQADKDAHISQLENKKAVIEGKMGVAQAELELIQAQGNASIDAENQKNEAIAEARDNLVQHLVDLGVEEQNADALVKEYMAGNIQEYDRVVSEVSTNVHENLSNSASGAAINVNNSAKSMVDSLFAVGKQAVSAAKSVLSIGSENPVETIKENVNGVIDVIKNFDPKQTVGDFQKQVKDKINIDRYAKTEREVKLELDISNYQKAIGDIDSQIALLESGGIKSLNDYLESGGSGSKGSSSKGTSEEVNYIDRLLSQSERRIQQYQNELEDAFTIDEKDSAINKIVTETEYQLKQMNDVYAYYSKAASEKLAQIPQELRDTVRDGTIDIEKLNDENLVNLINEFWKLDGQADDAMDKIRDLNKSINDLAQQKVQIRIDFLEDKNDNLNKRLDKYKSLISAVVSGIENEIDDVNNYYDKKVDKIQSQIDALESQKKVYQDQLDELNKQNEALEIQKKLEDALYAKRKAENNKNVMIYREGKGFVHEADQDAIRDANEQYDEAIFDKKKYDLQSQIDAFDNQIDALDETIDKLEKTRDSEIDYLNSIKDSWSSIEETAERIANMQMADDFWGEGWFSDIMGGDASYLDDITEKFQTTYGAISNNQQVIDSLTGLKDNLAYVDSETALKTANMASNFSMIGTTATTASGNVNTAFSMIPFYTEESRVLNEGPMLLWGSQFTTFGGQACGVANSIASSYESMATRLEAAAERAVRAIKRIKSAEQDDDDDDGYARGTRNAKPGLHDISEGNKTELIKKNDGTLLLSKQETLYPFEGGETVYNPQETRSILSGHGLSTINLENVINHEAERRMIPELASDYFMPNITMPKIDYSKLVARDTGTKNEFNFNGGIQITEAHNVMDVAKGIVRGHLDQAIEQVMSKR